MHRDSLGNESIVRAGNVQWTTAGRGIIHAEGPTKEFVKKGGDLEGIQLGLIKTQTDVNVFTLKTTSKGIMTIDISSKHNALVYLLDGEILVNDSKTLKKGAHQMATFQQDGDAIAIEAVLESNVLILSGEPINEKVKQYGPYVMNTQTEILEALRDYNQGKMGYLY